VPKNSKVSILLDNKVLTTGFPELIVSKGKGSSIRAIYSESLFIDKINKGNRNEIKGKHIIGISDVFLPDGGMNRNYQALWYRPCRFIQLDIVTKGEPLVIDDFYNVYTTYPLEEKAHFQCDNPIYAKIWDAAWRTDLLCAQDQLEADAYYEAMQYAHDTKVYGPSYSIVSGDYTLYKQAIQQFNQSRIPDGLSLGAYPADWHQIWPFFSLDWCDMVHDYTMLTGDLSVAKEVLPGVRCVFDWYNRHLNEKGLLRKLEWANPHGAEENSSLFTLQYAYSLLNAAKVCELLGQNEEAAADKRLAAKLNETVYRLCWVEKEKLMADSPDKDNFRNWNSIIGILTDAIPQEKQKETMLRIISDTTIKMWVGCNEALTGYPEYFFLFQALKKTGLSDHFTQLLAPWKFQIEVLGLTTFKQDPIEPIRSDCLPWSTTPLYYFFNLVCGIEPVVPGYHQIKIEPSFGDLKMINATFPLPDGMISMDLKRDGDKVEGTIQLPEKMKGVFVWKNQQVTLKGGKQTINL
jgi:alpha-L-rhamnosidase